MNAPRTNIKPATPLPYWFAEDVGPKGKFWALGSGNEVVANILARSDAAYLKHAANAYPKLVEALRHFEHDPVDDAAMKLLRELGEAD